MKRVFVDANIVIDLLCERYPWFLKVLRIFSMGDLGQIELFCSSLSLGTASYIMETRKLSTQDIFDGIALLCKMYTYHRRRISGKECPHFRFHRF